MKKKLFKSFALVCALIFAISCNNKGTTGPGGSTGSGGSTGGGGGTTGGGYVLPKGSLSQAEQQQPLDPNVSTKVLWQRRQGGNFRIPALITTRNGVIIAASDNRYNTTADLGNGNTIDVEIRRSTDLGNTWEPAVKIKKATGTATSYGDAFFINCHNGDVILGVVEEPGFFQNGAKTTLYRSKDDGKTWNQIQQISIPAGYSRGFGASGQGLTLRHGANKGAQRLMFAFLAKKSNNDLAVYAFISDDDGNSWREGGNTGKIDGNNIDETKAFELSDGRVMLNHRRPAGTGSRSWSIASTYNGNFTFQGIDPEVTDPGNNADLVRYEFDGVPIVNRGDNYALLIHANSKPNNASGKKWFFARFNHHIKLTKNEFGNGIGTANQKYAYDKQLVNGGDKLYSGYPTITVLPDGTIGTLTEETTDGSQSDAYSIVWRRFNLYWLSGGTEYVDYSNGPRFQQPITK